MSNITFTDSEYLNRKRITKREEFLNIMDHIIPWQEWLDFIAPFYYTSGKRGRPPIKLESILRMYLLQCWFNLSDEGVEEAIYDSYAMRNFMKINFYTESVPDATTLLKFRHLPDKNSLAEVLFNAVKKGLAANGCLMQGGTIVDATIISAPSSTKNQTKSRDPAMASTKKGNQYYFGMKCHAGMDTGSGLVHTIETTSASVHDVVVASKLIREDDTSVYGDSGYLGMEKREEMQAHPACSSLDFRIIQRPSALKALPKWCADWQIERRKAEIRSSVEHAYDLSDEAVVCGWVENIYWQYFTGETYLQTKAPIDPSSLTRGRKRLGVAGMEALLKSTLDASFKRGALQAKQCQTVLVDTTVMPKAVAYPTDSKLLEKARINLVKIAEQSRIILRQNYNRVAPKLILQIGRYAHAKQFKRMNRQLKKLKNIVGRIKRDIERQWNHVNQEAHSVFDPLMLKAQRAIDQNKDSKNKLYAWHAPEVECIAKGKVRNPYEFGVKVSLATTAKNGFVLCAQAMPSAPYDGHTLKEQP